MFAFMSIFMKYVGVRKSPQYRWGLNPCTSGHLEPIATCAPMPLCNYFQILQTILNTEHFTEKIFVKIIPKIAMHSNDWARRLWSWKKKKKLNNKGAVCCFMYSRSNGTIFD